MQLQGSRIDLGAKGVMWERQVLSASRKLRGGHRRRKGLRICKWLPRAHQVCWWRWPECGLLDVPGGNLRTERMDQWVKLLLQGVSRTSTYKMEKWRPGNSRELDKGQSARPVQWRPRAWLSNKVKGRD